MTVDLRVAVYHHILETGRVPSVAHLAMRTGMVPDDVGRELRQLQAIHALALAPGSDEILMAHPFSASPTPYVVRTADRSFWANCAWDALAIPAVLAVDARVDARCPDCAEPIPLTFRAGLLQEHEGVVHFAVPPRRFWENVGYT